MTVYVVETLNSVYEIDTERSKFLRISGKNQPDGKLGWDGYRRDYVAIRPFDVEDWPGSSPYVFLNDVDYLRLSEVQFVYESDNATAIIELADYYDNTDVSDLIEEAEWDES